MKTSLLIAVIAPVAVMAQLPTTTLTSTIMNPVTVTSVASGLQSITFDTSGISGSMTINPSTATSGASSGTPLISSISSANTAAVSSAASKLSSAASAASTSATGGAGMVVPGAAGLAFAAVAALL